MDCVVGVWASLYQETTSDRRSGPGFCGMIGNTRKIEKKLPFGTISNRNLYSGSKRRTRRLRKGGPTKLSAWLELPTAERFPPSIFRMVPLLGCDRRERSDGPRPDNRRPGWPWAETEESTHTEACVPGAKVSGSDPPRD
jgi:hypothetical protein